MAQYESTITTYCTADDLDSYWSSTGVTSRLDDNEDGVLDATEQLHRTAALERATNTINARLTMRYKLADLTGNLWARDCCIILACYYVGMRRGEGVGPILVADFDRYMTELREIAAGDLELPQQTPSFDTRPVATNYEPDMRSRNVRVRRNDKTSTGGRLPSGLKSYNTDEESER